MATSQWTLRGFVIYPEALVGAAPEIRLAISDTFSRVAALESLANEMQMFDNAARLSADGGTTMTHRALNSALTQPMLIALLDIFQNEAAVLPISFWVVDADTNVVVGTNTASQVGDVVTYSDALAALGLVPWVDPDALM